MSIYRSRKREANGEEIDLGDQKFRDRQELKATDGKACRWA